MNFDFGKALKKAQIDKGVRSKDLAESLGVYKQQVTRWRSMPDARMSLCMRMAKALDMDLVDFIRGGM